MDIPLKYELTQDILALISNLGIKRLLFENIQVPSELVDNLQRKSLLKSSLFSAKIEGNTLDENDFNHLIKSDKNLKERLEVQNIISALSFIRNKSILKVDMDLVLDLHGMVMKGLMSNPGSIRKNSSAIFNESGFPVYIPPSPLDIEELLPKLIAYINNNSNEHLLIKAFLFHLNFEKIHPFIDGNGRVGRLLLSTLLIKAGYSFKGVVSIEELLNERKQEYYTYLDKNDATSFIEFMLEIINEQAEKMLGELGSGEYKKEDFLLPRRGEILEIIRDHEIVSLDFIKRRFFRVSSRMLRFDLKKLEEEGYIIKLGATRGARYKIK